MSSHPSQEESNAARAFLACSTGDLCERSRLWLEFLKSVQENLAGGSKDEQTKNMKAES